MTFDWNVLRANWPSFAHGMWVTFTIAILSMAVALVVGLALALMRASSSRPLRAVAQVYIEIFRALPLYVFLLWAYYGLKIALNLGVGDIATVVATLGLVTAAYMAEIYRSGLLAVHREQVQAGHAVGLSTPQIYAHIVVPQMTRIILPATVNQFVGVLKGATIAGIIGVADVMYFARTSTVQTYQPFEYYTIAGVMLILGTLLFALLGSYLETRYRW